MTRRCAGWWRRPSPAGCGWAWRTTGDTRFRDRVIRELDAACSLKDWNPSHFLDTAEMSTAVAIGYDWLYPVLNAQQRRRYEDTLLDKGLRVVGKVHPKTGWWTGATNNWSQVCGTGMALAAEAVKERDPELCGALVKHGDGRNACTVPSQRLVDALGLGVLGQDIRHEQPF